MTRTKSRVLAAAAALALAGSAAATADARPVPDIPPPSDKPNLNMSRALLAAQIDPGRPNTAITRGSKRAVIRIERLLRRRGLLSRQFVDGHFGSSTKSAYAAWQRLFGGRPDVIGQSLVFEGSGDPDVYRIVGVMPEGFSYGLPVDMWRPSLLVELPIGARVRLWRYDAVVARLRPGASIDQARAELVAISDTLARDYPKTAFLMGSSGKPQAPNFSVFDNYIQEPAYLSGMIAGGMTRTNQIGMVGGYPIPEVNRLMHAFMEGAREVNPKVKFTVSFIGSWFDPPKAKETAFAQIDGGADLLYAERFGVSDAAKEKKVLAIGNVIDTQADYPDTVVASALWHFESTLDKAISEVKAGTFKADDYGIYSFMKNGGCSLAPLGTFDSKVPDAIKVKVAEKEKMIKDGSFAVEINDAEPKST